LTDLSEQLILGDSFVKRKENFFFTSTIPASTAICLLGLSTVKFISMARRVVEISGHIIDSLLLAKILDLIVSLGAEFKILEVRIGQRRADRSYARIQIDAPTPEILAQVVAKIGEHGALPVTIDDAVAPENARAR
jgi:hypothetical protein